MTAIEEFSIEAAKRYLQSVVFVDDDIYQSVSGRPAVPDLEIGGMPSPYKSKAPSDAATASTTQPGEVQREVLGTPVKDQRPYHPKNLLESFAAEGMVCALYEPSKGFQSDTKSELFKLCERADAVILDWDLYGEDGRNILPLITNLVNQSQSSVPHQVRLCAIYTTKPNLEQVANQIFEALGKAQLEVDVVEGTSLRAGASKIIVLGKPNSVGRNATSKAAEVEETALADRIIREFAALHHGILSAMALHGMASIRMNSKKILDKFQPDLDAPFLLHRALILSDEDAFTQIPELVAEEVLAVMFDNQIAPDKTFELAKEAVQAIDLKTVVWSVPKGKPNDKAGKLASRFLVGGFAEIEGEFELPKKGLNHSQLHTAMGCDETLADKKLAALFNLRTSYVPQKELTFGTVVRWPTAAGEWQYALSLMPECDCVRLTKGKRYSFPFWKLATVKPGGPAKGMVVPGDEGKFVELFASGKPRDNLWLDSFEAGEGGTVMALVEDGKHLFIGNEVKMEWVSQLKPAHVQRVAQDIGQSLSRVGVVEAEWLRLKSQGRDN